MKAHIQIVVTHWRKKSTHIKRVFLNSTVARDDFDTIHKCADRPKGKTLRCDYCLRSKWKRSLGGWKRTVNYDGAVVEYIVRPIQIVRDKPKIKCICTSKEEGCVCDHFKRVCNCADCVRVSGSPKPKEKK